MEKRQRIFRRRADSSSAPRLPLRLDPTRSAQFNDIVPRRPQPSGVGLRQAVDQQVLERHSPPHVVVNQQGDVMYYSAWTGKYLEAPAGAPTRQLQTMARKDLRLELRTLFREAVESGRSVTRPGVKVGTDDGRVQLVSITIEPMSDGGLAEPVFLVLFADQGPLLTREEALQRAPASHDGTALNAERELRDTRDRLQSMIEEYETALEELKSSNEELVSLNEEMQSSNEELEASKEELQSVNEELHTVNAELNGKVEALDHANSDLLNLFGSTEVATIFLDRALVIRSFTPAAAKVFSIRPGDRGRPLTDLSARIDLGSLEEDIVSVFRGHAPVERRADSRDPRAHYLMRIAPYRGGNSRIDGVVVTLLDVTSLTEAEGRQMLLIAELQHRTRHLLGLVHSIARRTLSKSEALDEFAERLSALGRAQSLLGGNLRGHVELAEIVALELQAVAAPEARVVVSGPQVMLDFELVQTLCLALHELATNAAKHGALKSAAGALQVSWTLEQDSDGSSMLLLQWKESGVPITAPPKRKGFGRELIEKALSYTLKAKTKLDFTSDGVVCTVQLALPRHDADVDLGPPVHPKPEG